ncbi:hypothetical protein [Burkholderia paludis]|uniref:hypothetical protein n=1 Tax=Burkholderia paludis TaxID=1506587 RepID=UPI001269C304|nr:hypothetical protein [Burkholderia paludis]
MSQGDLTRAAQCVEQASTLFANRAAGYRSHVNVLSAGDGAPCLSAGGDPNIRSGDSCRWPVDDEVRAIVVDRPAMPYRRALAVAAKYLAREPDVNGILANSICMCRMRGVPTRVLSGGRGVRGAGRAGRRAGRVDHWRREAADRRRPTTIAHGSRRAPHRTTRTR